MTSKENDALTIFMSLMIGELKLATKDASHSVNELTRTFMEMVRDVHEIKACAERASTQKDTNASLQEIIAVSNTFLDKVQAGTVGFQFYDKMTQRISHASNSMQRSLTLFGNTSVTADSPGWEQLRKDIEGRYNTEQDRTLYSSIMEGKSVKDAVELASAKQTTKADNVELF